MRDNIYIRLGLPVIIVCIVAAAGLAVTWAFTADKIEAQAREAERASLAAVLPAAAEFEQVTDATGRQYPGPVAVGVMGANREVYAKALGCAPGTVKSRLSRALERLRSELREDEA